MKGYDVTFERVGRGRMAGETHHVTARDADHLAREIHALIRGKRVLASHDFEVTVDMRAGTGSVEYGRFGSFAFVPCAQAHP